MNERVTRSSTRPRPRNPPAPTQRFSAPNTSKSGTKATTSGNKQKPTERASTSSNSRYTRSTAKNLENKRRDQRDDEGPRRNRVISVGEKYQTQLPECNPNRVRSLDSPERESCVWNMPEGQSATKVEEFCIQVYERLNIGSERALFHLYNNDFDYEKAMDSAAKSSELRDEWSENDNYCFHGLFSTYGRDFQKIHQIMAHKSMRSIIEHYYRVKLQNNYASIVDRDAIRYELSRKTSTDDKEPNVLKPMTCQNCGTCSLLYHVNNKMQCLACKKFFEEFNCNRTVNHLDKLLNFKFTNEVTGMVSDFKEMCEPLETGKSKCEEIKQSAINSCRMLRSEALRKDVNAGRIAQKVVNEVNLDDYKKLLVAGNASSARLRITNVWTNNEKNAAVQALIRYDGDLEAAASVLGTKTAEMVNDFYVKYEQALSEAMKTKPDMTHKRRQQAEQQYNKMLTEMEKTVEVVDLD